MSVDEDPIGDHIKTVYAHFGLALYHGQVLEHGIVNALVVLDLIPSHITSPRFQVRWDALVDDFFTTKFKQTLGQLIRNLKAVTLPPPRLETLLAQALEKRNWLAHHYFRERAEQFMSTAGRGRMIDELEEIQTLFTDADAELVAAIKPVREKYGYTEARLEAAFREMINASTDDRG